MSKKTIKLDAINKRILATIHKQADLSNQELADKVGLSPSACFQRTKALREAGYFFNVHTEMDLDRICEHLLAYVEVRLESNTPLFRKPFEKAIQDIPEFMDCLRVEGDFHYMMFTCFPNIQTLNLTVDALAADETLGIKEYKIRTVLERSKWYLGYPLEKLKWLE